MELEWDSDKSTKTCVLCRKAWTFTNRRHHCRHCGRLVCESCSMRRLVLALSSSPITNGNSNNPNNYNSKVEELESSKRSTKRSSWISGTMNGNPQRVCNGCYKVLTKREEIQQEVNAKREKERALLESSSLISDSLLHVYLLDGSYKTVFFDDVTTASEISSGICYSVKSGLFEVHQDIRDPEQYKLIPANECITNITSRWTNSNFNTAKLVIPIYDEQSCHYSQVPPKITALKTTNRLISNEISPKKSENSSNIFRNQSRSRSPSPTPRIDLNSKSPNSTYTPPRNDRSKNKNKPQQQLGDNLVELMSGFDEDNIIPQISSNDRMAKEIEVLRNELNLLQGKYDVLKSIVTKKKNIEMDDNEQIKKVYNKKNNNQVDRLSTNNNNIWNSSPPTANGISLYKKPGVSRSNEAIFSINDINDTQSVSSSNGGIIERSGDLPNTTMLKSIKSSENLAQLSSLYFPDPIPILGRDDIMTSTIAPQINKLNNPDHNSISNNDGLNTPLYKNLESSNLSPNNSNNNFDFTLLVRTFFYQINGIEAFCLRYNQILSNAICDPESDLYPNFSEQSTITPSINTSPFRDGPPDGRGNEARKVITDPSSLSQIYEMASGLESLYEYVLNFAEGWNREIKQWLLFSFKSHLIYPISDPQIIKTIISCLSKENMLDDKETRDIVTNIIDFSFDGGTVPLNVSDISSASSTQVLEILDRIDQTLNFVVGDLLPLLPPDFQIINLYQDRAYRKIRDEIISFYVTNRQNLIIKDLLRFLSFTDSQHRTLSKHGIDTSMVADLSMDLLKQSSSVYQKSFKKLLTNLNDIDDKSVPELQEEDGTSIGLGCIWPDELIEYLRDTLKDISKQLQSPIKETLYLVILETLPEFINRQMFWLGKCETLSNSINREQAVERLCSYMNSHLHLCSLMEQIRNNILSQDVEGKEADQLAKSFKKIILLISEQPSKASHVMIQLAVDEAKDILKVGLFRAGWEHSSSGNIFFGKFADSIDATPAVTKPRESFIASRTSFMLGRASFAMKSSPSTNNELSSTHAIQTTGSKVMGLLYTTIEKYCGDLKIYLCETNYKKYFKFLLQEMLKNSVEIYIELLLTSSPIVSTIALDRIKGDVKIFELIQNEYKECFESYTPFENSMKSLRDIVNLLKMDSRLMSEFVRGELYTDFGTNAVRIWQTCMLMRSESKQVVDAIYDQIMQSWSPNPITPLYNALNFADKLKSKKKW